MVPSLEFAIRVRPPLHQQEAENVGLYVDPSERVIVGNKYFFTADHALPSNPSQSFVFERFSGNVRKFLEGYDVSFVAFGRSKSGKTYSLVGPINQNFLDVGPNSGIIHRVAHHMFNYLNKARLSSGLNFNVFFSFFEAPFEEIGIDGPHFHESINPKSPTDLPVNNNFTSKECSSFEEVVQCLQMAMKNYPHERSHHFENSHTNCFFRLTLHQQLMQAGKMYAKSSRCTFVDLGSYESNYCFGLSNQIVQHLRVSNSGLELISRVLANIAEEPEPSSQILQVPSVIIAALKDILKYSSKTILLYCVSPCSMDSSNSINDLLVIERLRLLYGTHIADRKNQSHDMKMMMNHDHDMGKDEAPSLEFAASQWQLLVSNAECLFQKLVQGEIPADAKGQIEQWLFLKQECEDCFKQDSRGFEKTKCSLDRIDEVTESEGKTSLENSGESEPENIDDEDDDYEDETEDSLRNDLACVRSESDKREFTEKLQNYLGRFRTVTDQLVSDLYDAKSMRLFNDPHQIEGKRFSLHRKAASAESLLTPTLERTDKADNQIMVQSEISEPSSNVDRIASPDDGVVRSDEMLRVEIASLRVTKDYLHEQKRELTTKMNETKYITNEDQRKLIEADEAIDAIDSAMEFKNEMLCGRIGLPKTDLEERGGRMLTERLLNLSNHEMRILLCKYFKKVVDLREAGRKMEKVIADQDHQLETQTFKINALTHAIRQTRVDCERQLIMVREQQEKKYQVNFHHFASESSGASISTDNRSDNHSTTTTTSTSTNTGPLFEIGGGVTVPAADKALTAIPQQNLKKLQGLSTHTTKVTRKANKLIIQQERSKKK